tara:strand:- start:8920 stop:9849 length:930 start_codon:yes stop_codon:yes gene_type:complete
MKTLVIVEHDNENISSSTLCAVSAAQKLGQDVDLLVASSTNNIAEKAQKIMGISKVLNFVGDNFKNEIAEDLTACVLEVSQHYNFFVASSSTTGKNLMPRISALLDVQQISEVIEIVDNNTFKKPIYAGACIATVESQQEKNIITVRTTAFEKALSEGGSGQIENIDIPETESRKSVFVGNELTVSDRPELTSADIVISGGRGMQDGNNFALLDSVANKLNAAVGASRAAVDSGFAPNDYQVGQTGKSVAPNLYIAVGISGAIQHLAGMKDSKTIVAINKDEEAPIFKVADYGLVGDLFDVLPELESKI